MAGFDPFTESHIVGGAEISPAFDRSRTTRELDDGIRERGYQFGRVSFGKSRTRTPL